METIDKIHALQEEIQECNRAMAATYDDCNAEQNAARLKYDEQVSKLLWFDVERLYKTI